MTLAASLLLVTRRRTQFAPPRLKRVREEGGDARQTRLVSRSGEGAQLERSRRLCRQLSGRRRLLEWPERRVRGRVVAKARPACSRAGRLPSARALGPLELRFYGAPCSWRRACATRSPRASSFTGSRGQRWSWCATPRRGPWTPTTTWAKRRPRRARRWPLGVAASWGALLPRGEGVQSSGWWLKPRCRSPGVTSTSSCLVAVK